MICIRTLNQLRGIREFEEIANHLTKCVVDASEENPHVYGAYKDLMGDSRILLLTFATYVWIAETLQEVIDFRDDRPGDSQVSRFVDDWLNAPKPETRLYRAEGNRQPFMLILPASLRELKEAA